MTELVVDASVAVKWFIPEVYEAEAKRFLDPNNLLLAPDLLPSEFGNILWKKVGRGEITPDEARRIADAMRDAPISFAASRDLLPAALEIALGTGRTVYDSMYVALAVSRACSLVTADRKLYNALQNSPYEKFLLWVEV
jgi:predicted nucleic acid-binding protein